MKDLAQIGKSGGTDLRKCASHPALNTSWKFSWWCLPWMLMLEFYNNKKKPAWIKPNEQGSTHYQTPRYCQYRAHSHSQHKHCIFPSQGPGGQSFPWPHHPLTPAQLLVEKSILFLEFPLTHIVSLTFMIDWWVRLSKPRVFCSYCFEKGGDESLVFGS